MIVVLPRSSQLSTTQELLICRCIRSFNHCVKQNFFFQLSMLPGQHWMKREDMVKKIVAVLTDIFRNPSWFWKRAGRCQNGMLQMWRRDWDSLKLLFRCATRVSSMSFRGNCLGGERKATEFKYVVESLVRGATKVKGYPSPRTKGTYTVSEACEHKLAEVGLNLS